MTCHVEIIFPIAKESSFGEDCSRDSNNMWMLPKPNLSPGIEHSYHLPHSVVLDAAVEMDSMFDPDSWVRPLDDGSKWLSRSGQREPKGFLCC